MLSNEDDNFVRDYEVVYDSTLLDLHYFICGDLGYDPSNMASFFSSNGEWEKLDEFTLMDMGGDGNYTSLSMESVDMGHVLRHNNDRLIYVFDPFADRCMFIELTGTEKARDVSLYPRTVLSCGEPPIQFDSSLESEDRSIFDDAMEGFSDFEGDDGYDDQY